MIKELLYVYGLIPAHEIDPANEVACRMKRHGDIIAVLEAVDPQVFSQQSIQRYVEDPNWVKEKAVGHHNVLAMLQQRHTVIPLKFCTIYESEQSLEAMLIRHYDEITDLFAALRGKEEWSLKVYCDKEELKTHVMQSSLELAKLSADLSGLSPGKQFLMKKQLNASLERETENAMKRICLEAHESLSSSTLQQIEKKVWERKVTGRKEEMIWNSMYLTDRQRVDSFLQLVKQFGEEFQAFGLTFEATGPWPVYHFARIGPEEA
ncbi:GvpL/GvpF family gas vesicle protein [Paenibacillus montanisoli]|nr:GvpL/GvpF family gas vesicle protein [Paenibacillus montanisoli]